MNTRPMSPNNSTHDIFRSSMSKLTNIPKVSHYHSDGSGRDAYIKFDNGGFRKKWENNFHNIFASK
jgi:hypothetical protein